jgi:hypothetical protein
MYVPIYIHVPIGRKIRLQLDHRKARCGDNLDRPENQSDVLRATGKKVIDYITLTMNQLYSIL